MFLHIKRERFACAAFVRDDFRHSALEVVDDFLLAETERELVRHVEQVADDLFVIAVETADGKAELLRDVDDVRDVPREDEARQVQHDARAQTRAEVLRAAREGNGLF